MPQLFSSVFSFPDESIFRGREKIVLSQWRFILRTLSKMTDKAELSCLKRNEVT